MADSVDVENAIANAITDVIGPLVGTTFAIPEPIDAATYGPQTVPPTLIHISRPLQRVLEDRLAAGRASISVEPDENDVTDDQYVNEGRQADLVSQDPVTVTATPTAPLGTGLAWRIAGAATPGNIIGVQADMLGATYPVLGGDTPTSIAAALAAQAVAAGIPAVSVADVFGVTSGSATVRIGASSTWRFAVSRVARHFDVHYWCPTPFVRQFFIKQVESLFAPGEKLSMPDGSVATIRTKIGTQSFTTLTSDGAERDDLFVARTRWLIGFTVTRTAVRAPVVAMTINLNPAGVDPTAPILASQL